MKKVLVVHGPNLNLLGSREIEHYGTATLETIDRELKELARELDLEVGCFQSNHEGEIVDKLQEAGRSFDGLLINPGGYTHTSVAIRDALLAIRIPAVEVHLSNPYGREKFRKKNFISDVVNGQVSGFGKDSYMLGLRALKSILGKGK